MELTSLQQQLLEIFIWFHAFCDEHKLRYYALGGTSLGAVRHHGFIPWDDDLDVGMPLSDYLKFIQLTQSLSNCPYKVESTLNAGKYFFYPYTKIYDTRTTLVENKRFPLKRGIYLDLFPLCGLGNTWQETKKNFWHIHRLQVLLTASNMAIRQNRKWYKNLILYSVRIATNEYLIHEIASKIHQLILQFPFDEAKYVGNPVGAWGIREIMPAEYIGKPTIYSFENHPMYGPQNNMYGDYKTLPPEEKRVSHHSHLYLNLTESYLVQRSHP